MSMTKEDVLYGLCNLAVGDEEETKVAELTDLTMEELDLICEEKYVEAYRMTIKRTGIKVTLQECEEWVLDHGYADCYEEMAAMARNMMAEQMSVWYDERPGIDGLEYLYVIDEGFSASWIEQVSNRWPDLNGPFYIYPGPDEVTTIVSTSHLDDEQLLALRNPQDPLL